MAHCPNHNEAVADRVCSVCGRYFCGECVSERYYPSFSHICHECSGEKIPEAPSEAEEAPKTAEAEPEPKETSVLISSLKDRIIVSSEWFVLAVCVVIVAYPLLDGRGRAAEEFTLTTDIPEDVTEHCLGLLDQMEYQGVTPSMVEVKHACPYPIDVTEENGAFLVVAPDPEEYGFSEILVELNPTLLTVLE